MNYSDLMKLGGSAMVAKGTVDGIQLLRNRHRRIDRRIRAKNLLIGATIGTAAGAIAGLLLAPQAGRKTREILVQRTGETIDAIRERVSDAGQRFAERVGEKASSIRDAAGTCAESVKAAVDDPSEDTNPDGKDKKAKKK